MSTEPYRDDIDAELGKARSTDFIRHQADIEAIYTYEGTASIQSLLVGRDITGLSAFV